MSDGERIRRAKTLGQIAKRLNTPLLTRKLREFVCECPAATLTFGNTMMFLTAGVVFLQHRGRAGSFAISKQKSSKTQIVARKNRQKKHLARRMHRLRATDHPA